MSTYDFSQFDIKKTLGLITGSLLNHPSTAQEYREQDPDWTQTLITLTLPVVLLVFVLGYVFATVFGTISIFSMGGAKMFFLMLVTSVLSVFVFAFAASFLAGTFGGTNNFNRGFALASLVAVVGYTGSVLGTIPWIGWLLSLAAGIYALVLFYRGVPAFLDVPEEKRVVHMVLTIVAVLVVNMLISFSVGGGMTASRFG